MDFVDDCLFDLIDDCDELRRYFTAQVEVLIEQIAKRSWGHRVQAWDASGQSHALPLGLALHGLDVVSAGAEAETDPPTEIASRLRTRVQWNVQQPAKPVDVVVAGYDQFANNLTETDLTTTVEQLRRALHSDGLLLAINPDNDHLLRTRSRMVSPRVFKTSRGRCICLAVREWLGSEQTYDITRYVIRDIDGSCVVHKMRKTQRAWRRAEVTMALSAAGFTDIQWQALNQETLLLQARAAK